MITRTIESATVNCLCLNIETKEVTEKRFSFTSNLKTADAIISEITKENQTETFRIVNVDMATIEKTQALYGMSETDFLKYAHKMETRFKMEEVSE